MPKRINDDHQQFRDVYSGRIRKSLKKFINNGNIFRTRPNGKRIPITIPKMDIPHIVYGDNDSGSGRGKGKDGDTIQKGKDKGQKGEAGQEEGEGVTISLDLDQVLKFMQDELKLPDLKPRNSQVLEDEQIKQESLIAYAQPRGRVHHLDEIDGASDILWITNKSGIFNLDPRGIRDIAGDISSAELSPLLNKYPGDFVVGSGEVLYLENLDPIARNDNKSEIIKIVLEF